MANYIHMTPTASVEAVKVDAPFAAVVTIDAKVSPEWRHMVSEWLVEKGCLYMIAHGQECSLWDDSVDWANIEAYKFKDIPDDKSIMTTWHEDESLQEVLYFAISSIPFYPLIKHMVILDISDNPRESEILKIFKAAQDEINEDRKDDVEEKFPPEAILKNFFRWVLDRLSAVL